MPFLRPFSSKLAVLAAVAFVLSGCMTTSSIPAPVEHRDSQQAKGIVLDSGQVAIDTKQPGQADYRLAQTPQSGVRGQWPESRIAATDPNKSLQRDGQPPLVGVTQANGSVVIAPASIQQQRLTQATDKPTNANVVQGSLSAPTIIREAAKSNAPTLATKQAPKPVAIASTSNAKPIERSENAAATPTSAAAKKVVPTKPLAVAKQPAAQPTPKANTKIALADTPKEAKPDVKKSVTKPATKSAPNKTVASDSKFIWPAHGALVQKFADKKSMGIGISGRAGDRINATADGEVIFSGLGPRGYGKLLIVKHNPELLSVYAHNRNLLVKEGQAVRQGQKIAELGSTGTDRPKLHFEIRRQGKPVDPLAFLPQRK